jgi:hypothetical protein
LKPPRKISPADFEGICDGFGIQQSNRTLLRQQLDELVEVFRRAMEAGKLAPDRIADTDKVRKALKHVRSARRLAERIGPVGVHAFRRATHKISPMVNSDWLRTKFPNDPNTPEDLEIWPPGRQFRHPALWQDLLTRLADRDAEQRWNFVYGRTAGTMAAILGDIEDSLEAVSRALALLPGARGGRQRLTFRRDLLVNLAEFWSLQGGKVLTTQSSDFGSFCDAVCEAIGWPVEGLSSAIPDAVRLWRNLPGKKAG